MKVLLITLTIFLLSSHFCIAQSDANSLIATSCLEAENEDKNVLIIFTNVGCGWCRKLIKNISSEPCNNLFTKQYVVRQLNVYYQDSSRNTNGALQLLKEIDAIQSGIPFWFIMNYKAEILENSFKANGENIGFPSSEDMDLFIDKIRRTSNFTERELKKISMSFLADIHTGEIP